MLTLGTVVLSNVEVAEDERDILRMAGLINAGNIVGRACSWQLAVLGYSLVHAVGV